MPVDVKKMLIKMQCQFRYGSAYVYASPPGAPWSYRQYFPIFGARRMWRWFDLMKSRGLKVSIFRFSA